MRRATLLATLGLALGLGLFGPPGPPAAAQHMADHGGTGADAGAAAVHIDFAALSPAHVDIVAGERVTWTNDSARVHTVTADDASFDSGRITSSQTFGHRFTASGQAAYHCVLHPFIHGTVGVHDLLLEPPPAAAAPKRPFVLVGRASSALAPGTAVSLQADRGSGYAPVAATTVRQDGTFAATFVPTATATYRAVAATATSPPLELLVLDRRIALTARRAGGRVVVRARVSPASHGGHLALQLFLPERFGWWPVRRARLDGASSARFSVRTHRRLQARVVLTLPDGATRLAVSRTVRVGPPR
jgi:plastocyanin